MKKCMETDKKITHILVECPELIASVRVGVLEPLAPLVEKGKSEVCFKRTMDVKKSDILWCDILVCVRGSETRTLQIVQTSKRNGRYIIYFLDDDLLNIPENLSCTAYYQDAKIKQNIQQILQLSNKLWVVNPKIAEQYTRYCPDFFLGKVPAKFERQESITESETVMKFIYAGSKDHEANVKAYIAPAVRLICEKYAKRVRFCFVGVDSGIHEFSCVSNYTYFDDYDEYRDFIKKQNFSYGLAVIDKTNFYQCKYYNKYIEYGSMGIVGIFTNSMPYSWVIRDGYNGYLVENTIESWYNILKYVIENTVEQVPALTKNIYDNLLQEFNREIVSEELEKGIGELSRYKAPKTTKKNIKIDSSRLMVYVNKAYILCKRYGVGAVPIIFEKGMKKVRKKHIWRGKNRK